jgi:hypothetical protein
MGETPARTATSSTNNPTQTGVLLSPILHGDRPTANRLSHGCFNYLVTVRGMYCAYSEVGTALKARHTLCTRVSVLVPTQGTNTDTSSSIGAKNRKTLRNTDLHNTQTTQLTNIHALSGIWTPPPIPAIERPHTRALDHAAPRDTQYLNTAVDNDNYT